MKTKTMLSIEEDLKNEADEYLRTHRDARTFSGLVSLALEEFIHRDEKKQNELEQDNIKMMLLKQSLLAWENLCQDMYETFEQPSTVPPANPQKMDRWKNTMEQQQQVITLFIAPAHKK